MRRGGHGQHAAEEHLAPTVPAERSIREPDGIRRRARHARVELSAVGHSQARVAVIGVAADVLAGDQSIERCPVDGK